jgi:hypothetical protein
MRPTHPFFAFAVAALLAACGPGSNTNADGGDAGPACTDCRDKINVHCRSAGGDEGAAACNTRLMATSMGMTAGARFFIGDRRACNPNPNNSMCRPLCELSEMSFTNTGGTNPAFCEFNMMTPGCSINFNTGYSVVVELPNGRRSNTAVADSGSCSGSPGQNRSWGLINLEDLRTAATCAADTPATGYDPPTSFVACDDNSDNCTAASRTTCQERMFRVMTMMGPRMYARKFCSRMCANDSECGTAGRCSNGDCVHRCGGPCGLSCPDTFTCNEGACIPLPL